VTRFFDIDEANELVPEVRTILESLREQRMELIRLRDQVEARRGTAESPTQREPGEVPARRGSRGPESSDAERDDDGGAGETAWRDPEVRVLRLRMQGVIDQMQAGVARIDGLGITLRDIESGLIDFPALVAGRQVWLCWRLGEGEIDWWHELGDGFGGRQPLAELH
jgi:hypothetical protein